MRTIKIRLYFVIFLIFVSSVVTHAEITQFKAGDRICFIGDSITHAGSYHTQILLFYATRFPQLKLDAWNCGINGDSAMGAFRRYQWDIAIHKPTVATIMLGMNDVDRYRYSANFAGNENESKKALAIASSAAFVERLVQQLMADGSRVVLIGPSIYDQTGQQKIENLHGVNDALQICSEKDRLIAEKCKIGYVDFNQKMSNINAAWQAKDPDFSIIGPDRIHPGVVGHMVMAYLFLKAQGMTPTVSEMNIDYAQKVVRTQKNCDISKLTITDHEITFECMEKALPFPVTANSQKTLQLIPFTEDLNQETLKVTNLPEADYELRIDGQLIGKTTATALANGLNLAILQNTPQYIQALKVRGLLEERANIFATNLRFLSFVECQGYFKDLEDTTAETRVKYLNAELERMKSADAEGNKDRIALFTKYLTNITRRDELEKKADDLFQQAYRENIPVPHLYKISGVVQ